MMLTLAARRPPPAAKGPLLRSIMPTDFDPQHLAPLDRYKLMIGAILPRPIAWVSTCDRDGRHNLAPFSFFAGVSATPMSLLFCPANRADGLEKDTLRNARPPAGPLAGDTPVGVGQFVVNVVPFALARAMAACAEDLPHGQSEFTLAGLTPAPSTRVRPPRVAESPLAFECETLNVLNLAPGAPGGGNIVIGRVVHVHAREGLVSDRHHIDPAALDAIGRMGGSGYCRTTERFDLPMGRAALG